MPFTSVFAEIDTSVVFERPKVAVSAGPLGISFGVQLAAVFQSPDIGSRSHWALIPYVIVGTRNMRQQLTAAAIRVFIAVTSEVLTDARDYCRSKLATGQTQ